MHFQLLLTICTPRTIHNLRRVEKTYIIYFYFLSVGGIFATKHSKNHWHFIVYAMSKKWTFLQLYNLKLNIMVQLDTKLRKTSNKHERESYFTETSESYNIQLAYVYKIKFCDSLK